MKKSISRILSVVLVLLVAIAQMPITAYAAPTFNQGDIDVVNGLIDTVSGLGAIMTKWETGDTPPTSWQSKVIWTGPTEQRIISLLWPNLAISGEIDVTGLSELIQLSCNNTNISKINVSGLVNLSGLNCSNTDVSELDVSTNTALKQLNCSNNTISTLDISNNAAVSHFDCSNNQLLDIIGLGAQTFSYGYSTAGQQVRIPVIKNSAGGYISYNTYPLEAGHTLTLANPNASYITATGHFTISDYNETSTFSTILKGALDVKGTISFELKCEVEFQDWDGSVLKKELVDLNGAAVAPAQESLPGRNGYTFTGWDKDFSNVQDNMVITAQYKKDPIRADEKQNTIEVVGGTTQTANKPFKVTGTGHRQDAAGETDGDERYIPIKVSAAVTAENFVKANGGYGAEITLTAKGTYQLVASYQLQRWDGSKWQDVAGEIDTKEATVIINPGESGTKPVEPGNKPVESAPATGDDSNIFTYLVIMAIAILIAIGAIIKRKKELRQ